MGDITKIEYRSSWEQKFFIWCDKHSGVLKWGSEVVVIPYKKPTDNKMHRYFVDIMLVYKNKAGKVVKELIEIKPEAQTKAPRRKKNGKSNVYEQVTYAINIAKWQAATKWANERGIKFRILTEKQLFR
jgi:hypothetical protein